MYLSITSSCIKEIKHGEASATFGGSTSYRSNSINEIEKKPTKNSNSTRVIPMAALISSPSQKSVKTAICRSDREYKLNKPVIRQKMRAFFNLQATKEFCAFYSISFPFGISDDDAYTLFNIWQTRCRQTYGLKSFIWVSERQKNGTIHFHLLTNTRMPIKAVNSFMRTSLRPYYHKYGWELREDKPYNGVDVDNVWYPKIRPGKPPKKRRTRNDAASHLSLYITKYVSKNNETFSRLAWHQSRDIAALFTCQNYDIDECTQLLSYFHATKDNWKKYDSEYVTVYLHPSVYDLTPYIQLREVNETVYRHFHAHTIPA